jgi:signal transduction histidine kinase/FixJ family two-component response regulator
MLMETASSGLRILEMVATAAPLADTLAELIRFIEAREEGSRCGILIVSEDREHFRRGSGPSLPEAYHQALDGVPITPPYFGPCGQAAHQGVAALVPDIAKDVRWPEAWRNLMSACGLAACRSAPIFGSNGRVLASFAMYYDRPGEPSPAHPQLIEMAARLAGIALERQRSETALRESEERLSAELAAAQQLQVISAELIREQGIEGLYDKLVEAAATIMRSEYASMQMLYPERGSGGELRLLAFRGFNPQAAKFWEWVRADSESTCGAALRTGKRVIAPDVEICDFMAGTEDLKTYLQTGIRAVQTTPLISRSGRLIGMISTHWREPHEPPETDLRRLDVLARQAADLIERAQAEAALRDANALLEEHVSERSRELEAAMAEQRKAEFALHQAQRLDAVGRLTGGVAHDFNNLLTVVIGNLDLMRHFSSKAGGIPKDTLRRLVDSTHRAASRGERLTKQLLAFSRQDALQPQVLDLHATLDAFAPILQRAVGETIEMRLAFGGGRAFSKLDLAQFEAAILNLIINARDAMPKGGSLTVETKVIRIEAEDARRDSALAEGSYVVISVIDTGTGIAPAILEKAFEPFFTTKEIGKGSGLGLSQVYGFTKQSGGHVTIDSEIGRGTTVKLYLPQSSEAPDSHTVIPNREARGGAETILIVEDNADVQEAVIDALDSLGYLTALARDGREALRVLHSRNDIDLLFTDHVMPGDLSGVELARQARKLRPGLKVLLTSGYAKHTTSNSRNAEGFPSIAKPYRRSELAESIRAALDHRSTNGTKTKGSAGEPRSVQHVARAAPSIGEETDVTLPASGE